MSKPKTIREWLNELPESDSKKAIRYYEQYHGNRPGIKVGSLLFALSSAFPWDSTDEGYMYWGRYAFGVVIESINKEE